MFEIYIRKVNQTIIYLLVKAIFKHMLMPYYQFNDLHLKNGCEFKYS